MERKVCCIPDYIFFYQLHLLNMLFRAGVTACYLVILRYRCKEEGREEKSNKDGQMRNTVE